MSLLHRSFINNQPVFPPLFRLLDEFDNYSRSMERPFRTQLKSFTPKFDVKELNDSYELQGELPGIDQKDIEIEFTDNQTLTIKGRTEHSSARGTPPAGYIEGEDAKGAITEGSEDNKSHQATVEDEGADGQAVVQAKQPDAAEQYSKQEPASEEKFWVSERSVGDFSRSFSFPIRIDQDAVRASMQNGILSILVPKAKKADGRKIAIE